MAKAKSSTIESEKAKSEPAAEGTRLRIKLKSYDHKLIDVSCKQIIEMALRHGAEVAGPVPLPTEIRRFTVNSSSFIHKDAREQFEMRIHKRLIDVLHPTPKAIDSMTNLNLPAGVDIEIKMG